MPSGSRPTQVYRVKTHGSCRNTARRAAGHRCSDRRILHGRLARLLAIRPPARIHRRDFRTGPPEVAGHLGNIALALSTGPHLHHQGCVRVNPTLTKKIGSDPSGYYVDIPSKQYPQGAVRAQL